MQGLRVRTKRYSSEHINENTFCFEGRMSFVPMSRHEDEYDDIDDEDECKDELEETKEACRQDDIDELNELVDIDDANDSDEQLPPMDSVLVGMCPNCDPDGVYSGGIGGDDSTSDHDHDHDDTDDDYDDASSTVSCGCSQCRAGMGRIVPSANASLYDGGDDQDNEDNEPYEDHEDYEDYEDYGDYWDYEQQEDSEQDDSQSEDESRNDEERCAVCFGRPKKETNPLASLPCCGKDGREETSSTRFCTICLNKCLMSYPLLPTTVPSNRRRIGECPRCRTLIVTRGTPKEGTIAMADFRETVTFAMAKQNMRSILLLAAFAPDPRWIPVELFGHLDFDLEHCCQMLCQWGIWKNKNGGIYFMEPPQQQELKAHIAEEEMAEYTDEKTPLWVTSGKLFLAGVTSFFNFKPYTALRIFHHCIYVFLRAIGGLPSIEFLDLPWWQRWLLIALNLFLVGITAAMLMVFVVYGAISFMAVMTVRWAISSPKTARCAVLALFAFLTYRYMSWGEKIWTLLSLSSVRVR
jgi:hypothetical protein